VSPVTVTRLCDTMATRQASPVTNMQTLEESVPRWVGKSGREATGTLCALGARRDRQQGGARHSVPGVLAEVQPAAGRAPSEAVVLTVSEPASWVWLTQFKRNSEEWTSAAGSLNGRDIPDAIGCSVRSRQGLRAPMRHRRGQFSRT
jgi:hypothetical protein